MFNKRLFLTKRRRRSNRFLNLKTLLQSLNPVSGLSISRRLSSSADKLMRVRLGSDNSELDIGFKNKVLDTQALIDFGGYNLLGYTEDFSNSSWVKQSGVVLTQTSDVAPTGKNGWEVDFTNGAFIFQFVSQQHISFLQDVVLSLYVKGVVGEKINIGFTNSTDNHSEIVTFNGDWQRVNITRDFQTDLSGNTTSLRVVVTKNAATSSPFKIASWQFEAGNTPTSYQSRSAGGASDCFVTTWYDQIGSNHATQTISTNQPKIYDVLTGDVTRENGKPAMVFDGTDDNLSIPNSQSFFTGLHKHNEFGEFFGLFAPDTVQNTANAHVFSNSTGSNSVGYNLVYRNSPNPFIRSIIFRGVAGTNAIVTNDITANDGSQKLYNAIVGSTFTEKTNNVNGIANSSYNNPRSSLNATHDFRIGCNGVASNNYKGTIQELIIFNKNLTSEENNTLHNDINNHYNIF